jgi:DNA-binding transcriptional MerR regulator
MGPTDRFSPDEVQRILGLTEKQLDYWERLRLVSPRKEKGNRYYDFGDLIGLRTVKQLVENGIPANRLRRSLAALREKLAHVKAPLSELRVLSDGGAVIVERGGTRLEPLSGQFVLNFETHELNESVRVMTGRSADEWLAVALEYEAEGNNRAQAIDAYERAFCVDPARPDALINCGTLYYEDGNLEKASEYFRQALVLDPENALAHFNLGRVYGRGAPAPAAGGPAESHLSGRALQPGVRLRKTEGLCRSEAALAGLCEIGPNGSLGELCAPALHYFQGGKLGGRNIRPDFSCNERNKSQVPVVKRAVQRI